jgi:hypothetical protein
MKEKLCLDIEYKKMVKLLCGGNAYRTHKLKPLLVHYSENP